MAVRTKPLEERQRREQVLEAGEELEAFTRSLGADVYGVASSEAYMHQFSQKPPPTKFVPDARSVIVVGMPFTRELYATVAKPWLAEVKRKSAEDEALAKDRKERPPVGAERYYTGEESTLLTHEMSMIAYRVAWKLHREGYTAFYFPPVKTNPRFKTAPFYFMPAMYLAGLGQLGYNCAILNPEYGPRMRVTCIITNKELPVGTPMPAPRYEGCEGCMECVQRCPSRALDGEGWKNIFKCAAYGCCGTCLSVCPVGARTLRS